MKTMAKIFTLLLLAIVAVTGCGQRAVEQPLDQVTVQLNWFHQTQFAGFYAADQHGYYAAEGLAVKLLPLPAPGSDPIALVIDGSADLGLYPGTALIVARSQGQPVTAIAAIYRCHPAAFITLAGSGIARPHDFPGHTMRALPPGGGVAISFQAMMTRLGLDPKSVQPVEAGFDMAPLFDGEVDIWPGFVTNEVLNARKLGYQVNVILPEAYGVHTYGDTLFTSERLLQDDPDLVLRFLRATLQGWQWAIENSEEAGALALKYDPELDMAHEEALMKASIPLIYTGEDHIGWMRPEVWQGTHDILLDQGILAGPVDVNQVYTLEFLQAIYGGEP